MAWLAYRLVYRALAPVHIGWHTLGYIKLTRPYITGRAMWGALTANLTRTFGAVGTSDYRKFGTFFQEEVLASYFFPARDPDHPFFPHFTEQGLVFGKDPYDLGRDEFERLFIGAFGQTAVLPESNTAEDDSLHESEFIAPAIHEDGVITPVSFVGYLFIKENASLDGRKVGWRTNEIRLSCACRNIFVGGDIKYGWGRLALANDPEQDGPQTKIFGNDFISANNRPRITIPENGPLPGHLDVAAGYKVRGDIEPLVGREWAGTGGASGNGAGQKISEAKRCWMPGSTITDPQGVTLQINGLGILT